MKNIFGWLSRKDSSDVYSECMMEEDDARVLIDSGRFNQFSSESSLSTQNAEVTMREIGNSIIYSAKDSTSLPFGDFCGSEISDQEIELIAKRLFEIYKTLNKNHSTNVIDDDKYIQVMSLCPYLLNLSTVPGGKGKVYTFTSFGESKNILSKDLKEVIESNQSFAEELFFFVFDISFVDIYKLTQFYKKFFTGQNVHALLEELKENKSPISDDLFTEVKLNDNLSKKEFNKEPCQYCGCKTYADQISCVMCGAPIHIEKEDNNDFGTLTINKFATLTKEFDFD
jgi:hypothetical protein